MSVSKYKQMSGAAVSPYSQTASAPLPLNGGRRRRASRARRGGDEPAAPVIDGGRRMTRKQRASVKKVARALKAANKKAHRLAMTLKKKLRR